MLAALLLAGVCAATPLFDDTGPLCGDLTAECRCTECMPWDPPASGGTARRYEINRRDPDGTTGLVGTVREVQWPNGDGTFETSAPATVWCAARDLTMPREGQAYFYKVRACNDAGCSDWSPEIEYVAAPYAIDHFQPPVVGNP